MKFKIHMKDPDGVYDSIQNAVEASLDDIEDSDERQALREVRESKLSETCSKWFEYKEYLTVEVDTEAGTCTVVER